MSNVKPTLVCWPPRSPFHKLYPPLEAAPGGTEGKDTSRTATDTSRTATDARTNRTPDTPDTTQTSPAVATPGHAAAVLPRGIEGVHALYQHSAAVSLVILRHYNENMVVYEAQLSRQVFARGRGRGGTLISFGPVWLDVDPSYVAKYKRGKNNTLRVECSSMDCRYYGVELKAPAESVVPQTREFRFRHSRLSHHKWRLRWAGNGDTWCEHWEPQHNAWWPVHHLYISEKTLMGIPVGVHYIEARYWCTREWPPQASEGPRTTLITPVKPEAENVAWHARRLCGEMNQ